MTLTEAPALAPGTYRIAPSRTTVRFTVKEMLGLVTVHGTFTVRDGVIDVAPDPAASTVRVRLDPATFTTDRPRRDRDVKSRRFLDVAAYPEMEFASTGLTRTGEGWRMTGALTAHGETAPVVLSLVEGGQTANGIRLVATGRVDRYALGVRAAPGIIARHLDVRIEAVAVR